MRKVNYSACFTGGRRFLANLLQSKSIITKEENYVKEVRSQRPNFVRSPGDMTCHYECEARGNLTVVQLKNLCQSEKRAAFTLVETLIALVIIGIIAAMTLPSLFSSLTDKIRGHQLSVFTRKIAKGTDLLNIENGIGPYYTSTRDFIERGLSKHLKIITICDAGEDMKNCFTYDKIYSGDSYADVQKIKYGENFGLNKDDYPDVAGIVLGDGTPMILSWNVNCPVSDPDVVATDGNLSQDGNKTYSCISGFVDLNGNKGPNRVSTFDNENGVKLGDVVAFGKASKLGDTCLYRISSGSHKGKCLMKPQNEYRMVSYNECMKIKGSIGISGCHPSGSYYVGAALACGGRTNLPSKEDLKEIALMLYPEYAAQINADRGVQTPWPWPSARVERVKNFARLLGLPERTFALYCSSPETSSWAYYLNSENVTGFSNVNYMPYNNYAAPICIE